MLTTFAVLTRILSNSVANLYQKKAVAKVSPVVVNLCSSFVMSVICLIPALYVDWSVYTWEFWSYVVLAGALCTVGTVALIEALRIGELSVLAPINSYKSIIGLLSAMVLLKELPNALEILCIGLILLGSYFVLDSKEEPFSLSTFMRRDIQLRIFALLCTGIEASILKKIILMSSFQISLILWAFSGFVCSLLIYFIFRPKLDNSSSPESIKNYLMIAITLLAMQLTTNYVFLKLSVGVALALFQLSSLVSLFFGYKVFHEKNIVRKLIGTLIMISSAVVILLK